MNPNSLSKGIQSRSGVVSIGQQALFAYVDALAKVILSTLPDTDEDTRKAAVARGKLAIPGF
jgi:hypothetical protein